jgi:hypothetical protein
VTTDLSQLVASLHDHAQRAASEAQAIEDPSTSRAITELAKGLQEMARYLKETEG